MEKNTERLFLVLTKRDKAVLTRLAEQEGGVSQASVVRRLLRIAAKERAIGQGAGCSCAEVRR